MLPLVSVHHVVDTVTHALALLLNVVLLVVVHTTNTPSLTPYKCIFTFTCINDILLASVVLGTQPAIFCDMRMICFISNGFVSQSAPWIVFTCQATFCGLCITTFAYLSVPFLYRYHNLCRQVNSLLSSLTILLDFSGKASLSTLIKYAAIPSILACVDITSLCRAFMSELYSKREQLDVIIAAGWATEDTDENAQRIVCAAAGDPYLTLHGLINCATSTFGFLCIGWSEYKIVRHVQLYKPIMAPSALQRQRELHYALIAMVVCPLVSTVIPTIVFVMSAVFGHRLGEYSAFMTTMVSLITLANPVMTCYLVRPFRRRVVDALCYVCRLKKTIVAPENGTQPSSTG